MTAELIHNIREEVIGLLFNRYVFRTHQEIVRRNPRLQGHPRSVAGEWGWIEYAVANAVGVRRLASATYQDGDVNLVRLLDAFIPDPGPLGGLRAHYYPSDAARTRAELGQAGNRPRSSYVTQALGQ